VTSACVVALSLAVMAVAKASNMAHNSYLRWVGLALINECIDQHDARLASQGY
jgi:hypothetical protein